MVDRGRARSFARRSPEIAHHPGSRPVAAGTARAGCLIFLALGVANCSGPHAGKRGNKYGVAASPRVIEDGQPIPKGGGRAVTGKPYVVGGRTYLPHDGPGYDRDGMASWYGSAFHGRLTANGEIFDRGSIAAAHPTLPLPSYVRVTNAANGRSMIVRVNDRGPYEHDRLIDVSEQVADALGFKRNGVSRVRVQYVGRASVHGSDDEKLLATLRTDGSPAPAGGSRGRTMLASLGEDAATPLGRERERRTGAREEADAAGRTERSGVGVGGTPAAGAARAARDELSAPEPGANRSPEPTTFAEIYFASPDGRRLASGHDPFRSLVPKPVIALRE